MKVTINLSHELLYGYENCPTQVIASGSTVGECLQDLVKQVPAIKREIFDEDGNISIGTWVFLNKKSTFPNEFTAEVKDGDVIDLMPVMAGG